MPKSFLSTVTIVIVLLAIPSSAAAGLLSPALGSPFQVGSRPLGIVVADFNRDGKLDFASVNSNGNNVYVMLGNGAGGFTLSSGSPYATGTNPRSIVAEDFNLDGKIDLAIANGSSSNVTLLLGNGSGGFSDGGAGKRGSAAQTGGGGPNRKVRKSTTF